MIALLRYSGIPARYAYGTIQVPMEQVMNWVGGVTAPEAALQLLGQGGIPSIGLTSGGTFKAVKLEHVWVEAYVDFIPSRGAVNKTPDTWVPLDASFKQYQFTQGLDLKTAVPFDAQALANQIKASAQVNETEGWVTGVNSSLIQTTLTNYQTQVKSYIDTTKPNATVGEVLGTQTIIPENFPHLMGTLPYQTIVVGNKTSTLPASLRHSIALNLYNTTLDRALDSPALTHTISLPKLNSHRLGVTYQPATAADAQLIESYKTQGATSLPLYLIQVKPLIQIDGTTVATGSPIGMGQDQYWDVTLFDPQGLNTGTESFKATAGNELVFGINGNGITPEVIQQRFAATPSDTAAENLHQVALHYWMENDLFDHLAAVAYRVKQIRLPSVGMFASPMNVRYFFGIARSGTYSSRIMDVKRVMQAAVKQDGSSTIDYALTSGSQGSHLEGAVFEQLFGRALGAGISAMQLLRDANTAGIPVHRIDSLNIASVLSTLQLSSGVKADIVNAVNAGKLVITPEREVTHGSWAGAGYIIFDPQTGSGAYLIDGGLNGGSDLDCGDHPFPLVQVVVAVVLVALLLAILWPVIAEAIITVGVAAGNLAPLLKTLIAGTALLLTANAEAGPFNNNACCEGNKQEAALAAANLRKRLDEWDANVQGLRTRGHWDSIAQETGRLEEALKRIGSFCRGHNLPAEIGIWKVTAAEGRAFLSITPRP